MCEVPNSMNAIEEPRYWEESRGWVAEDNCRFEKSGYCDHVNPKICEHAQKIHKTRKGEVQQWICELML